MPRRRWPGALSAIVLELSGRFSDKGLGGLPKILRQVQPQAAGVIGALVFHAAGDQRDTRT